MLVAPRPREDCGRRRRKSPGQESEQRRLRDPNRRRCCLRCRNRHHTVSIYRLRDFIMIAILQLTRAMGCRDEKDYDRRCWCRAYGHSARQCCRSGATGLQSAATAHGPAWSCLASLDMFDKNWYVCRILVVGIEGYGSAADIKGDTTATVFPRWCQASTSNKPSTP
jgi:hypothetical protein